MLRDFCRQGILWLKRGVRATVERFAWRLMLWARRVYLRYISARDWRWRHKKVFSLHPEYRLPAPRQVEKEHLRLWRRLRPKVSIDTLRVCYNISGVADPRIVPEEVFFSEIETALGKRSHRVFLSNKNHYTRWWGDGLFPESLLHKVDGRYFGRSFERLHEEQVEQIVHELRYPAVAKPAEGSGGHDVVFCETPAELAAALEEAPDLVVQRAVEPHPFFRRFNDFGLNTVRACVYRSVETDVTHFLHAAVRIGRCGRLDNLKQGGLVRFIRDDGTLNAFALDIYGARFTKHPDTCLDLTVPERIPRYDELKDAAVALAEQVPGCRLVSFDFALDIHERWRPIEVNLRSQTIRFAQYAGEPFFGRFTEEVVSYCEKVALQMLESR